ncbi:MAG TPA: hemolysin III family protein [Nitrospirota bacterium]|nr:hemolysin III family protein [Nitrospirota bacterium]
MHKGERFNSITHLVGTILAACGTGVLVAMASVRGDPWRIVSVSIYGATLVVLYLFSTLYHSIRGVPVLRKLDHIAIYLLIAGSYTPFTLVPLRGAIGWTLFGSIWGLAVLGIVVDLLFTDKRRIIPVVIYLLMGWLVVAAIRPLLRTFPLNGFLWLLAGGILYTVGILFYVLDGKVRHSHGIWHLFVLGGSSAQYIAVLVYIL